MLVFLFCVFFLSIFNCRISYKKCSIYKPDAIANCFTKKKKVKYLTPQIIFFWIMRLCHVNSHDLFMWSHVICSCEIHANYLCKLVIKIHVILLFNVEFRLGTVGYDKFLLVFFFFSYRSIIYSIYLYSL